MMPDLAPCCTRSLFPSSNNQMSIFYESTDNFMPGATTRNTNLEIIAVFVSKMFWKEVRI